MMEIKKTDSKPADELLERRMNDYEVKGKEKEDLLVDKRKAKRAGV